MAKRHKRYRIIGWLTPPIHIHCFPFAKWLNWILCELKRHRIHCYKKWYRNFYTIINITVIINGTKKIVYRILVSPLASIHLISRCESTVLVFVCCVYCRQTPNKTSIRVCLRCYAFYDCLNDRRKAYTINHWWRPRELQPERVAIFILLVFSCYFVLLMCLHDDSIRLFCSILLLVNGCSACFGFLFLSKSNSKRFNVAVVFVYATALRSPLRLCLCWLV